MKQNTLQTSIYPWIYQPTCSCVEVLSSSWGTFYYHCAAKRKDSITEGGLAPANVVGSVVLGLST